MENKKKVRNGAVDILRFIFCMVVVLYHLYDETYEHFGMGYTGVEFFVIVSGVFFFAGWDKNRQLGEAYLPQYMKKRFFRFLPYTTLAMIVVAGIRLYQNIAAGTFTGTKLGYWVATDIWELLLVKMGGLNNHQAMLNGPAWTISAMLIVEFLILNMLTRNETAFRNFIAPLSILVGYGYWRSYEVPGPAPHTWLGITTFGVLRVYIATCVAYFVYLFAKRLQEIEFTPAGKKLLTTVEFGCFGMAMWIITCGWSRDYIWALVLLYAILIAVTYSGASYTPVIFQQNMVTDYLGKLSLTVYLMQAVPIKVFVSLYPEAYERYAHKTEFIAMAIILGVVLLPAADLSVFVCRKIKESFCKHCIKA